MSPQIFTYLTTALKVLSFIVGNASPALAIITEVATALEQFKTENRDPTSEEWASINSRISEALSILDVASQPKGVS